MGLGKKGLILIQKFEFLFLKRVSYHEWVRRTREKVIGADGASGDGKSCSAPPMRSRDQLPPLDARPRAPTPCQQQQQRQQQPQGQPQRACRYGAATGQRSGGKSTLREENQKETELQQTPSSGGTEQFSKVFVFLRKCFNLTLQTGKVLSYLKKKYLVTLVTPCSPPGWARSQFSYLACNLKSTSSC